MLRPLLVLLLALAATAGLATPATAQIQLQESSCGDAGGGLIILSEPSASSANFRTDGSGDVTAAQANSLLESVRARLAGDFGWTPAPNDPGIGRYHARFGDPADAGVQTEGDHAGTANDNRTCLVLPNDATLDELEPFVAREYSKAVWYGIGALNGATPAPAWLRESAAEAMEDEVFTDDTPDQLPPDNDASLAAYPADATGWLILRGMSERLGTGTAGGVEDVIQGAMDAHAAGATTALVSIAAGLGAKGLALPTAFHEYAIAARFLKPCDANRSFPCFTDAAAYGDAPTSHDQATSTDTDYAGTVPAGAALRWIDLPAGPYDATLTGAVTGSIVCPSGDALSVRSLPATERTRNIGCADGVLVVTSGTDEGEDVPFTLDFQPATALLTIARFGEGLIGSAPEGINCGTACSAVFPLGTKVTLGAQPDTGHAFAGWAGDCSGLAVCEITMDRDRAVGGGFVSLAPPTGPGVTPPTGPGSGPGSSDTEAPKMLIGKPRFNRKRSRMRIEFTCPATEATSCTGPITVVLKVGRKRYSYDDDALVALRPGRSERIVYKLGNSERSRLLRRKRVKVKVAVRARDEAFNARTTKKTFKKVKLPKRKKR